MSDALGASAAPEAPVLRIRVRPAGSAPADRAEPGAR